MSAKRNQFTFYESVRASIRLIKNKAARADAYDAICDYALYGTEPDLSALPDTAAMAFIAAKPNLDASRRKSESGKTGGGAKKSASKPKANGKQTESKQEANRKESASEIEIEIEKEIEIENECYLSIPNPFLHAPQESKPQAGHVAQTDLLTDYGNPNRSELTDRYFDKIFSYLSPEDRERDYKSNPIMVNAIAEKIRRKEIEV